MTGGRLSRRGFLRISAAAGLTAAAWPNLAARSAPAGKKLNVVLIMADDIAYDNLSCYGSDYFKTPRLDKLAETGAKFNHCYSEPVCTPSRVKIMTGRDGIRNYLRFGILDKKEITFGTVLKKAGYATAVAGKWQLHGDMKKPDGSLAPGCGFDTYCLWNYPGASRPRYWTPSLIRDGKKVPIKDGSYGPDICTDFLIDFIEKNKGRPFIEVKDRHEKTNIPPGKGSPPAEAARKKLRSAIDSMPEKPNTIPRPKVK